MKDFFKVTFLSAIFTFVKMLAGFIIGKVIAVYTGPSGIAMLGQVQSLVNIATGISTAPVSNGLVRYTAENWEQGEKSCAPWWTACLRITIIILAMLIPTAILCSHSLSFLFFGVYQYNWLIVFAACILPFSVANVLLSSIINGQQRYRQYIYLGMTSVLISTALMILLVIYFGLSGALIATALYNAIAGIIMIAFCASKPWLSIRYWFARVEKIHFKSALNYTVMALVTAAAMPIALLLVRKLLIGHVGWVSAGHWQAVWKISEVYLGVITIALSTYLVPRLSILKKSKLIRSEINNVAPFVIAATVVLAMIVYFLRDLSIKILFTADFNAARDLFLYQLIGDVLRISGLLYAYPMVVQGRTKVFIGSEITFSMLFALLSYLFISSYGVQGANVGYMISYFMYFIFTLFFTNVINPSLND